MADYVERENNNKSLGDVYAFPFFQSNEAEL